MNIDTPEIGPLLLNRWARNQVSPTRNRAMLKGIVP